MSIPPQSDEPLPRLPPRAEASHKGSFGTVLVVGGSRGMSGAAALAGMAALRGGAGLVRLAVPDGCLETVAALEPCYTTLSLPADRAGRIALEARDRIVKAAAQATIIALGPGLGQSPGLDALVSWLYRELRQPMVVDADALNALSHRPAVLTCGGGPRILTPHPGEFSRLVGADRLDVDQRTALACRRAADWGAVVVLKGHRTLVTEGQRQYVNRTGNPGMATGGSGDVLTGLIAALGAQGLPPWDAARLGVYLHGLAGDLAAEQLGQVSLQARDLVDFLPQALKRHQA